MIELEDFRDKGDCGPYYAETGFDAWYGPDEDDPDYGQTVIPKEYAKVARQICRACPVRLQCLTYAFENDERAGIWGGLTPYDRTRLKNQLAANAA